MHHTHVYRACTRTHLDDEQTMQVCTYVCAENDLCLAGGIDCLNTHACSGEHVLCRHTHAEQKEKHSTMTVCVCVCVCVCDTVCVCSRDSVYEILCDETKDGESFFSCLCVCLFVVLNLRVHASFLLPFPFKT